jgi:CHAT domain-containing protein/Tfp pilus assembly protein PilF
MKELFMKIKLNTFLIHMLRLFSVLRQLVFSIFVAGLLIGSVSYGVDPKPSGIKYALTLYQKDSGIKSNELDQLNLSLQFCLKKNDSVSSKPIVKLILNKINKSSFDSTTISDSYYLIGIFYSYTKNLNKAINYLNLSITIREKQKKADTRYARALYNLGIVYSQLGFFKKQEDFSLKSLEVEKKMYGTGSPLLVDTYLSLISAYISLQQYEKAINLSTIVLTIFRNKPDSVPVETTAGIYVNLGVCYIHLSDITKAKTYLDGAEAIYENNHLKHGEGYINLLNSLAITYGSLGNHNKENEYYEKGIALAVSINSTLAFNIINSYAIILGNTGQLKKGESLLTGALDRAKFIFGEDRLEYNEVLCLYADYLREYTLNYKKSIECYIRCIDYQRMNQQDLNLKNRIYTGYSLSLLKTGESKKALETIQSLLFSELIKNSDSVIYKNPSLEAIQPDKNSLKIFTTKYKILQEIYKKSADQKTLKAAASTAELIVSIIEKVRINISEEDSRLILGDKNREYYLDAIRDFNLLFSKTTDRHYLEKAFEYSEKSKVAGLLSSTRELKATQLHIPADIADLEKDLRRNIGLLNARIADETIKNEPDTALIRGWKENLIVNTVKRDSLILIFEKQFPDYYAIKYNTKVASLNEIPKIIGRDGNYINYIFSDTMLYIFVANRKNQMLVTHSIDTSFLNSIRQFRSLLSKPSRSVDSKSEFLKYQLIGNELCKTLIDPVKPYLISNRILISPDNIISYIPFETLPTSINTGERVQYRNLAYLMEDFDISYTYSATFMAESVKNDYSIVNKVIAFAPNYPEPINIQSVLLNRQLESGLLVDLPYARQEAEYVCNITGGNLFENDRANESVYKNEANKYDIIHLAMHTLLNDKDPMRSTLIFSQKNDSTNDGYLKTYEIYGIPIKAKMVVLSSCNTGSGFLSSGEGILSLARGFIYSGSQSVVMSMWEIEDRSGTEIVKLFYDNLKKGYSKSVALKNARIAYLENSDQLRSHPYFWSTLVVYGNNSPLYFSIYLKIAVGVLLIMIAGSIIFYFCKRKYS